MESKSNQPVQNRQSTSVRGDTHSGVLPLAASSASSELDSTSSFPAGTSTSSTTSHQASIDPSNVIPIEQMSYARLSRREVDLNDDIEDSILDDDDAANANANANANVSVGRPTPSPSQSNSFSSSKPQGAAIEMQRASQSVPASTIQHPFPRPPEMPPSADQGAATTIHLSSRTHSFEESGVLTVESSSPFHSIISFSRSRTCHWIIVLLFVFYLVIIPMILVSIYYLTIVEMLVSAMTSVAIGFLLYNLLWRHLVATHATLRLDIVNANLLERYAIFSRVVPKHWISEIYQLLLTLLSCSTYLFYTYNLSYEVNPVDGSGNYRLSIPSVDSFVQVEYFLIISLSMDYLGRLVNTRNQYTFIMSLYSILDLLCFTGVAYFNFFHANLAPQNSIYNYYLFQGPFRLLRMRRALKSLDAPIRGKSGLSLYRLGPFVVSKKTAFLLLFGLRVLLFICSAAALVLAFEFPCAAIRTPGQCSIELHSFHLCFYFLIVSLSTVGYGDVTCATDAGRMFMSVVIIYAVIQIPREIQMFADLEAEQKRIEQLHAQDEAAKRSIEELQQQQQSPGGSEVRLSASPSPIVSQATPSPTANDFSAIASSSPPPIASIPSAVPHSVPLSSNALSAFVSNDLPFLRRWAEHQLGHNGGMDAALLDRVAVAIGGVQLTKETNEYKIKTIVQALFK